MKYIKVLGLLAVAAAALMAFAGTASATKITSPEGVKYFGEIHATSEGHATLHPSGSQPDVECNSTVRGHLEVNDPHNGAPTTNASGTITTLDWTNCTNGYHATTVGDGGTLSINSANELFSSGATVEVTRFGISCRYLTNNTKIGTVTDSSETGGAATLDIAANIPFHSGSFLCGSGESAWTGSYEVNEPNPLFID